MKVKMLTSMVGLDFSYQPGDEVEVTEEVAKAWEVEGLALIVEGQQPKKTQKKKSDA